MKAKAIDTLNTYFTTRRGEQLNEWHEMESTTCKLTAVIPHLGAAPSKDEVIAQMDEAGVEKTFFMQLLMFSYKNKEPALSCTVDELAEWVSQAPDRFVGIATYDPYQITQSLRDIDKGVKEYGFKGVHVHIYGFDMPLNDAKMYPLYAKCVELGVPVSMQVGYVLEGMPSDAGRPIHLDRIALDFPELVMVGTHTGYPWCEGLVSICYKYENVYLGCSAHLPRYWDQTIINNINTRLRNKCIFGTNMIPAKMMLDQVEQLPLRDEVRPLLLRDNAIKVWKL